VLITAKVIYQGMRFAAQLDYAGCVVIGYYRRLGMLAARSASPWDGEPHSLNEVYRCSRGVNFLLPTVLSPSPLSISSFISPLAVFFLDWELTAMCSVAQLHVRRKRSLDDEETRVPYARSARSRWHVDGSTRPIR
jgi:hypothetical protein